MATPSGEAVQTLASTTSKRGLDREVQAALLRERTRPKCPEDNLRELTWDSNPDCGIVIPAKSPNLRHHQARSQNKGLSRTSRCGSAHPPLDTGRRGQPEPEGGNHGPRQASYTKLQAGFIANQDFLGFWMVDIHQEGRSQRSSPQKRHTAQLRRCVHCTPRKPSCLDAGGDKPQPPTGDDYTHQAPGHLSCLDLERAQNTGPTKSAPLWSTWEPEPEWLRPGKCMQSRAHLRQFLVEQPRAWAV